MQVDFNKFEIMLERQGLNFQVFPSMFYWLINMFFVKMSDLQFYTFSWKIGWTNCEPKKIAQTN